MITAEATGDSHIHLFSGGYPGRYDPLFPKGGEVDAYQKIRKVHGIHRALVVGYEGQPWAAGNNRHLAGLARKNPWMIPLAFCDATRAVAPKRFAAWWKEGFHGIALYVSTAKELKALLQWPEENFALLNGRRALISINTEEKLLRGMLPFAERLPGARFLFSHMCLTAKVDARLTAAGARKLLGPLLEFSRLPHAGVKLSGFYACTEPSHGYPHEGSRRLIEALHAGFGAKRLYWGSDFSPALDHVSFSQTIHVVGNYPWTAMERNAVFGGNLLRLAGGKKPA